MFDEERAGALQQVVWTRVSDGEVVGSIGVLCGRDWIELEYRYRHGE